MQKIRKNMDYKYILMKREDRAKLRAALKVPESTISEVLNFYRYSLRDRRYRLLAVNKFGGILITN